MDENNQTWWKQFIQNQSIIHPTNEYMSRFDDDFWIDLNENNFEDIDVEVEEENHQIPITIPLHPLVDPEINIGVKVAVISDDQSTYWIEKVKQTKKSKRKLIYTLHYYEKNPDTDVWKKMKKNHEQVIGSASIDAILLTNIKFTKKGTLSVNNDKKIMKLIKTWH